VGKGKSGRVLTTWFTGTLNLIDLTATLTLNYLDINVNGTESNYSVTRIANGIVEFLPSGIATIDTVNLRCNCHSFFGL
jgi:hypothetical protein